MSYYLECKSPPSISNSTQTSDKPRLLDQVRNVIRCKHYSIRTEHSYLDWIKRYILFHNKKHPQDMDEEHISAFLSHLAVMKKVASSTQNQALCAIVFLYREVLKKDLGEFQNLIRAKKPEKLPVVFTQEETKQVLLQLNGVHWLMGQLKREYKMIIKCCRSGFYFMKKQFSASLRLRAKIAVGFV